MPVYATSVDELIWTATLPDEIAGLLAAPDLPADAKPIVEAKLAVAQGLASLGDPLNDCVALISPQALISAVWRLPTAQRTSVLRDLMIPPARKPTRTAAAHALTLLRRFDQVRRRRIALALTRPVMEILLPGGPGAGPTEDSLRHALANVTFDRSLVRLAALAWWPAGPAASALLRAAITGGELAPDNWNADIVKEVARACDEFAIACRDITANADVAIPGTTVTTDAARVGTGAAAADEPELQHVDEAIAAARRALETVQAALALGRPPADEDISALAHVKQSLTVARLRIAEELGLPVEDVPEDRPGMAAELRARRAAIRAKEIGDVERAAGLVGPPGRAEFVAELRAMAAGLVADAAAWDDGQRRQVKAVTELVRLVDAVGQEADDDIIDALAEGARSALPNAALVTAALRGQLSFTAAETPAPAASTSPAGSVPVVAAPAPGTDEGRPGARDGEEAVGVPASHAGTPPRDTGTDVCTEPAPVGAGGERHDKEQDLGVAAAAADAKPGEARAAPGAVMSAVAVTELFAELIDGRRLGLAYHLAGTDAFAVTRESEHAAGCAEVVRACAYAESVRSDSGALAELLRAGLERVDPTALRSSRATQLLALAAAVRAAVLCGQFTHELLRGATAGLADLPALCTVARRVATASEQGALAQPDRLLVLTPIADADRLAQGSAAAAEADLHRVRTYSFARASVIAGRWWHPQTGLIGCLLAAAAENDRGRAAEVAAELRRLNKSGVLESALAALDDEIREGGTPRLEGAARNRLLDSARESLTFVRQWAEDTQRAAATTGSSPWATRPLRELRDALLAHRDELRTEMDRYSANATDTVIAAAVRFVHQSVDTTIGLFDGRTLSGPDPEAALLLNAELLRCPRMSLTDDGGLATTPVAEDIAEAAATDPHTAFRARVDAADFGGARLLAESLSRTDRQLPDDPAKDWFQQITERQELVQRELRARHDMVAQAVDGAARHGRLVDADRSRLGAALTTADIGRSDLGTVRAELQKIEDELSVCAALAEATLREDLERALLKNEGVVADVREAVEARIKEGDFATAEEYLLNARDGNHPPDGEIHDELTEYFPAVPDALPEGLTDAVVRAAATGSRFRSLDYTRLGTDERRSVSEAFQLWRDAKVEFCMRRGDPADYLSAPLRMVGIEYASRQPSPDLQDTPSQRRWVDLIGVRRIGHPLVPTFGSKSGDRLRLLLVRELMDVRTIVSWVRQDASDVPVLVCLFGALSAANRRQLADEAVRNRDKPFAVLDDTALAYLGSRGHRRINATTRLLLPFAAVNPYCPSVNERVPSEMFYGRQAERSALVDLNGTSLIYGGRQFGKSALLRATERHFDGLDGYRGIYVCLPGTGDGSDVALREAWSRIGGALTERGVIARRRKGEIEPFDADNVGRDVRAWLGADSRRRLLLLLDECDAFFESDAKVGFRETARLRDLMNDTGRRFKVVFAGLHQVQRFAGLPNQPLADAHFGKSTVIGPLKPKAAHDLLRVPTEALGIQFEDDALVHHVLTHCYYQPKLLQLAGEAIVDAVLALREESPSGPPYVVDRALLDTVLSSETFRTSVANAIELTLNLDSRYKLIALVMAHRAHEGHLGTTTTAELRAECRKWWDAGFESLASEEFRALLEEMVGLGVLARASDQAWRVRSSNVLRMLGTADEVVAALCSDRWATVTHLSAAASRTRLRSGSTSPLTWRQTTDLLGERTNQMRIVVGTPATCVGDVATALREAAESADDRFDFLAPGHAIDYRKGLRNEQSDGRHLVIVDDLTRLNSEHVREAVDQALDIEPRSRHTRAVTIVVNACDADVLMLVTDPEMRADPESVVSLTRLSVDGVRAWGIEDGRKSSFSTESDIRALLEHTGGWPILLGLVEERFAEPGLSAESACSRLEAHLRATEGARQFLDSTGVTADPHVRAAWKTIVDLDDPAPRDLLIDFLSGDEISAARADALLDALLALDLLIPTAEGLRAEPVAARAWRVAGHLES